MGMIKRFFRTIKSFISKAYAAFDIRAFFVFGGLMMLGYGLDLKWGEWLAFLVCGILLMLIGYIMREK